jgi:hypothetical protein
MVRVPKWCFVSKACRVLDRSVLDINHDLGCSFMDGLEYCQYHTTTDPGLWMAEVEFIVLLSQASGKQSLERCLAGNFWHAD